MIVNSLLSAVTKYFTSYAVPASIGYDKTLLIIADKNKLQTSKVFELDATTGMKLNYTVTPINVPTETRKAYIDGVLVQPMVLTVTGAIERTKLLELQELAKPEIWMYVMYHKNIGGTIKKHGYYTNSKLYFIKSLEISDIGNYNTVELSIQLQEVVLYAKSVSYRYGVKQTNPISGTGRDINAKGIGKKGDNVPGVYGERKGDSPRVRTGKYVKSMGRGFWNISDVAIGK